jgi:Lon protease-like protein
MTDDLSSLTSFDGTARLFPLPNVVLFPHVMLPLHIFEPRYRQMTADALAGDRLLTLVLLRPGWEADYEGKPALHSMACLGKILAEQQLPDGRYNLLLRGLSRGRILHEVADQKLYRTARLELVSSSGDPGLKDPHLRSELGRLATAWFKTLGMELDQITKLVNSELGLGTLSDVLGFALPLKVEFKQELLEDLDPIRRVRQLIHHLETESPDAAEGATPRRFPPEFSPN